LAFNPTDFATEFAAFPRLFDTEFAALLTVLLTEFAALFTADIVEFRAAVTGFVAVSAGGRSIAGMEGTGTEPLEKRPVILMNKKSMMLRIMMPGAKRMRPSCHVLCLYSCWNSV